MSLHSTTQNWKLLNMLANRHIFPNHISGHRAPKKDSALSKIRERRAKLKAVLESTNVYASSASH